jgi:hypothetical protein
MEKMDRQEERYIKDTGGELNYRAFHAILKYRKFIAGQTDEN